MTGYQTFEGYVALAGNIASAGVGDVADTIDTVYNFVANIYMFPVGSTASDQTIYVYYDNEPVSGATVLFELQPAASAGTTTTVLPALASSGLNAALSGTTDATGMVTFDGSSLVLGGLYTVTVLPTTHEGIQLAATGGTNMTVGAFTSPNIQVIAMADEVPGGASDGLYIVSVSPGDPQDTVLTGVMTVTFNRAIELVSEDTFSAALGGAANTAQLRNIVNTATYVAGDEVTASVSSDGLVLTMTPNFFAQPVKYDGTNGTAGTATADIGLTVTYTGGAVVLKGDDTTNAMGIFIAGALNDGVRNINNVDITRIVNITGLLDD